ncbi:tektin bundle-interacting protein 1 [Bombina bombina]|uniref:tektin bundle-interacting protein 1 n=1 Tax=Bombina bombina TaxID=8345 RepID=UPI00235ADBC0|nr:tektin bundle-interacting protein 1 [Bombina bombina]
MEYPTVREDVPRRTTATDFPAPLSSNEFLYLSGPTNAPIIHQAVHWRSGPWGTDGKSPMYYAGKNRETFQRWQQNHRDREQRALPNDERIKSLPLWQEYLRGFVSTVKSFKEF